MIFEKHNALSQADCENLIRLFERHKAYHHQGQTIGGLNPSVKDCTEVLFTPEYYQMNPLLEAVQEGLVEYEKRYPFLKTMNRYGQVENISFKRYNPNQAYHGLHCERSSLKTCARMLVWMFYLNTVHDGGETFFAHQNQKITATQGKLVIWPSDWTHAHKGLVSPTETKYITSSWLNFL